MTDEEKEEFDRYKEMVTAEIKRYREKLRAFVKENEILREQVEEWERAHRKETQGSG